MASVMLAVLLLVATQVSGGSGPWRFRQPWSFTPPSSSSFVCPSAKLATTSVTISSSPRFSQDLPLTASSFAVVRPRLRRDAASLELHVPATPALDSPPLTLRLRPAPPLLAPDVALVLPDARADADAVRQLQRCFYHGDADDGHRASLDLCGGGAVSDTVVKRASSSWPISLANVSERSPCCRAA